jgi:hypothetical protein
MSLYAIPGLMTAPTAPNSARRLRMPLEGKLSVVVWQDDEGNLPIGIRIVRAAAENTTEVLLNDPEGLRVLPRRNGDRYDYLLQINRAEDTLPVGDLLLWVMVPQQPRMVFSLYVPVLDIAPVVVSRPSNTSIAQDQLSGIKDLLVGDTLVTVTFPRELSSTPGWALPSVINTNAEAADIPVIFATVAGYSRSALTVSLSSPIQQTGLKLAWMVATSPVIAGDNQLGQFLIPAGSTVCSYSFSSPFAQTPAVFGSLQAIYSGQVVGVTSIIQNPTPNGFSVVLSSQAQGNLLFNWQARV